MSKKVKIILISIVAVLVTAVIVIVAIEEISKKKFTVVNNTGKNITSLGLMFETEEDGAVLKQFYDGPLNAGDKVSGKFEAINFGEEGGELGVVVTFEGYEEIYCYDGLFTGNFDGKIDLEFYETEGEYRLKSTAGVGIFNDTDNTSLDESEIIFDLEGNDWDYADYDFDMDEPLDDDMFEIVDEDDEDWDDEEWDDEDWDDEGKNAFEFILLSKCEVAGTKT